MSIEHSPSRQVCRRLRFNDLVELGIVRNRVTLGNWIRERGFPPGQLLGPNTRTWTENEVQSWLDSRPSTVRTVPPKGRGRPRKADSAQMVEA